MNIKYVIGANITLLLRSLNPSVELLGKLRCVNIINECLPTVKRQPTLNDKNGVLLDALTEVPEDCQESVMNDFIAALKSTSQEHVANILRRESDKVAMSDKNYRLLNNKMSQLCQFLEPRDGLLDHLFSNGVFTVSDCDSVTRSTIRDVKEMARQTVKILERKADDAFEVFICALNTTGQDHVVHVLTGIGRQPMSAERIELLHSHQKQLVMNLDPLNGVLSELAEAKAITSCDEVRIRGMIVGDYMVLGLVDTLTRKPDDVFDELIKASDRTGQRHITYILTGKGDCRPLSEECRAKLVKKRQVVVNSVYLSSVLSTLESKGVLSSNDRQRITDKRLTDNQKVELMLDLIARKPQAAFDGFIGTLLQCDHEHVVEELMGPEVDGELETQVKEDVEASELERNKNELCNDMQRALGSNNTEVKQLEQVLFPNGILVSKIEHGSIVVKFKCRDHAALLSLQDLYRSKQLDQLLTDAFRPQIANKGLESLSLCITDKEFQRHIQLKLMTSEHREALLSSADSLVDKITISDELLDKLSLCKQRIQAIKRAETCEQVNTLLNIVSRQPDCAFTQLLIALVATNQHEAADIIRGGYMKGEMASNTDEFPEIPADIAWKEVVKTVKLLLHSTDKQSMAYSSISYLRDVVKSLIVLRKALPMLIPSNDDELEQLLLTLDRSGPTLHSSTPDIESLSTVSSDSGMFLSVVFRMVNLSNCPF